MLLHIRGKVTLVIEPRSLRQPQCQEVKNVLPCDCFDALSSRVTSRPLKLVGFLRTNIVTVGPRSYSEAAGAAARTAVAGPADADLEAAAFAC